ncbi:phage tail tip lysozyme [Microbacterium oleivorans]|uniref:Lytic transglycosylase domain-containing protein n=1 Tax=Microbacterium oleivorans TaxID=273677 RepID=A0A4V3B369_9MICO|nr:phage tail tip lysozyme [Microbacterium oleivorans]TDL43580.1 lytic transglycosylase domain-containing protein [Microbacterium oleivorans]
MTSGNEILPTRSAVQTRGVMSPRRAVSAPRWSRRRGVLAAFSVMATAGFVAASLVPLASFPTRAEATELDPLSLYATAVHDAQRYQAGDAPGLELERASDYTVNVKPTPTPTPTPTPVKESSSGSSSSGSSSSGWSPPFVTPNPGSAQAIAYDMVTARGWGDSEFACLVALWNKESGWRVNAFNASSGAYGIPQATPGRKMASVGSDWETNPATQITWGLGYIQGRYGTPCGAWGKSQRSGWY